MGSEFLSGAEAGTVALTAGDWELARSYFARAAEAAEDLERRALAGPEALGEALASWALNDTQRTYQGEGFERVYVHCGLALTYLAQGLLEDVLVEARLANQLLEAEEKLYDQDYRAGGFGHLISGLAYELREQPGEAFLDYQRMLAKGVGESFAVAQLRRLANDLGREGELEKLSETYGEWQRPEPLQARIVVLAGVGLAPFKFESGLVLPSRKGIIKIVAPSYRFRAQPIRALHVSASGLGAQTTLIEDVGRVAKVNLSDRLLWSVGKSTARTFLKRELSQNLEDKYGGAGALVGGLFTLISERADLRSWLTLPDTWQAATLELPAGIHQVELGAIGGQSLDLGTFELEPGELMVVIARSLGTSVYAYPIGGRSIEHPFGGL